MSVSAVSLHPLVVFIIINQESICWILSFWWYPGVWILYADVSEHSVPSSYVEYVGRKYGTGCSETPVYKIRTPGNHPEERIQRSRQGESLQSRGMGLVSFWSSAASKRSNLAATFCVCARPSTSKIAHLLRINFKKPKTYFMCHQI